MAPKRSSRRQEPVEERPGSGQSPESLAKDIAAQPALLAAARTLIGPVPRARAEVHGGGVRKPRKFYNKIGNASSSSSSSRRRSDHSSMAYLTFVRSKYQKGEYKDALSGTVYFRGKVRYAKGTNEIFKTKVGAKMLAEPIRFNDDLKVYTGKVYTAKQAKMIRDAMKEVSKDDEETLDKNGPTDKSIDETFNFPEAKSTEIAVIKPVVVNGEEKVAIGQDTYAFKNEIDKKGFKFNGDMKLWLAPIDTDTDELEDLFEEYGFDVEYYDGMGEEVDEEDEDEAA